MLENNVFQKALPVLKKIEEHGYEAYFVGGSVRDVLLKQDISDVDIATSAFPQEIKTIFPKTIDVGIEHGTVMVLMGNESYEVTTFRTESTYQDYRRPDAVTFVRSLKDDLMRRDFTINALALNRYAQLFDYHNGLQDLKNKVIRCVGTASERFHEDALRMMRAVRFAGQLNFIIEDLTQQGISDNAHLLQHIAVERICVEWEKLMMSPYRLRGIKAFIETGLYAYCPLFRGHLEGLKKFIALDIRVSHSTVNWAILCYCFNLDTMQTGHLLKQWKLSNLAINHVKTIIEGLHWRAEREWLAQDLFHHNKEDVILIEQLAYQLGLIEKVSPVGQWHDELAIHSIKELAIDGRDIMLLLGRRNGGKYIGDIIDVLKHQVLTKAIVNNEKALREFVITQFNDLKE